MIALSLKVQFRVAGQPILGAERHVAARAYCKLCGHVKTAALPHDLYEGLGKSVIYSWSADICRQGLELLKPLFECMAKFAIANALTIRFDDTGAMVIAIKNLIKREYLEAKENGTTQDNVRKGINASGFYIETLVGVIILFYTDKNPKSSRQIAAARYKGRLM